MTVLVDDTAPRRAWREATRALIPRFAEVQLLCPTEICVERERVARWELAAPFRTVRGRPTADAAPDMRFDYEESLRPDLMVRTDVHDPWSAAELVLHLIRRLNRLASADIEEPERRAL